MALKRYGIPKSIDVKGKKYRINIVKWIGYKHNGDIIIGLFKPNKREILVVAQKDSVLQRETFLHELVHAIVHESGICQVLNSKVEEILCENAADVFENIMKKRR